MLWGKLDSQIIKMMDLINVFGLLLLSDVHKDQLRSERCVSVQVPLKKDQWSTDSVWKVKIRGIIFPPIISLPGLVTQKYLFFNLEQNKPSRCKQENMFEVISIPSTQMLFVCLWRYLTIYRGFQLGKGMRREESRRERDTFFVFTSLTKSTLTVWDQPSVDSLSHHSGGWSYRGERRKKGEGLKWN